MRVQEILDNIALEAGFPELVEEPKYLQMVLRWLDRYKLYLQRDKRFFLSEITSIITMKEQSRSTDLPSDYLFPIAIRRAQLGCNGIVLRRWISKEEFLNHFPVQAEQGEVAVGSTTDYMIQNRNVVWGKIPNHDETLYIDYFRALPAYNLLDNSEDTFSILYHDGLFYRGMYDVFDSYSPDATKADRWQKRMMISETGLRKYQVGQEIPMESDLILQDT